MKARSSVMELKCRAIDEKIMRNKRSEDERLKPLYILIERLGLDIGSERDQLQILDQKLNNDVKDLESHMTAEIEASASSARSSRPGSSSRLIPHARTCVRILPVRRSAAMSPRSVVRRRWQMRSCASPRVWTRRGRTGCLERMA